MVTLFGQNIAALVNQALGSQLESITLNVISEGARGADVTAGKTITSTPYVAKGICQEYQDYQIDGTIIRHGDRKFLLLAGSISVVPKVNDTITYQGVTRVILNIMSDPAQATYECQAR